MRYLMNIRLSVFGSEKLAKGEVVLWTIDGRLPNGIRSSVLSSLEIMDLVELHMESATEVLRAMTRKACVERPT